MAKGFLDPLSTLPQVGLLIIGDKEFLLELIGSFSFLNNLSILFSMFSFTLFLVKLKLLVFYLVVSLKFLVDLRKAFIFLVEDAIKELFIFWVDFSVLLSWTGLGCFS